MFTRLYNVYLITMDASYTAIPSAFIDLQDDRIIALGHWSSDMPHPDYDHLVDGQGAIAMPGMINIHTHLGMVPFRGLGDDTPDRLSRFLFPLEQHAMTEDLVYHSSRYAIAEMQLAGITTFFDMYYFEEAVAQAADTMGMRGIVAETIIADSPDCERAYGGLDYSLGLYDRWRDHSRIQVAIAPHAPYTNSDASLTKAHELAASNDSLYSLHLSEFTHEIDHYRTQHNETPVEYLHRLGVLSPQTLAAHCIYITASDIALLAQHDVAVAHCIAANTKSAKGIMPLKAMLDAGIRVGLGTDGPSSGNTLDLFSQMRMVANFHKTHLNDRSAFPAREIVKLATLGGAQALGLSDTIGSIEVGKKADITLIETQSVNMFPLYDPYSTLVYAANASNVSDVWVNGAQVIKQKQLVTHSLPSLRSDLQQAMTDFSQLAIKFAKDL